MVMSFEEEDGVHKWIDPPTPKGGGDLFVDFRAGTSLIAQISTAEETAYIKAHIAMYWTDPRFIGYQSTTLPPDLWGPWPVVRNCSASEFSYDDREFVLLNRETGRMKRFVVYEGTIHNRMENLTDFPFDADTVTIEFASTGNWRTRDGSIAGSVAKGAGFVLREVREKDEGNIIGVYWGGDISEWSMHGASYIMTDQKDKSGHITRQISLKFKICRRATYYMIKVLVPLYLLVLLFAGTFVFPVEDLPSRHDSTMTGFLAAFALIYVVSEHLPKTSFLTPVDKAILISLVSMATCAIANWVVYSIAINDTVDKAETINLWFGVALASVFSVSNFLIFARSAWRRRSTKLQWETLAKESKKAIEKRTSSSPALMEYHVWLD